LLPENKVSIAYQALALSRMLTVDDPSLKWDWKSGKPFGITFKVPGRLIQPINPDLAPTTCHFLFDGSQLMAFSTSLLDRLVEKDMKSIPTVKSTPNFPYRLGNSAGGVFCSGDSTSHERRQLRLKDLSVVHSWPAIGSSAAPAAHILHDPTISHDSEPCGLCLRPAPLCQFTLTKGKGRNSKPKIQMSGKNTSQCRNLLSFQYSAAAEMTDASPRTNVPIRCPRCSVDDPAVWRYNMEIHFRKQH
ncbi:hypothetical protein DFH08DRAFT_632851, partial [Mycena albidolilacea]